MSDQPKPRDPYATVIHKIDYSPTAAPEEPPIALVCSGCGRKFSVKPEFAGRSTHCPGCKEPLIVPRPAAERAHTVVERRRSEDAPVGETKAPVDGWATKAHRQCEEIIERFEAAWHNGARPAIEDYLPAQAESQAAVLVELAHTDLECRLKAGEPVRVESYLQRYPALAQDRQTMLGLVIREFELRRGNEPGLKLETYLQRFPTCADGLMRRFPAAKLAGPATPDRPGEVALPLRGSTARYIVGAEIARGGMGAVLSATDRDIRREVAVKYLLDQSDQDKQQRFVAEAQITGQLEHPNIVPVHELGVDGQRRVFFSMKMVKGCSLAQVLGALQRHEPAAVKEYTLHRLLNVFVSVCNALAYAHSREVIHRDLKPANIMIGDFGAVYVMDWGLAKVLQNSAALPLAVPVITDAGAPVVAGVALGDKVTTSRQQADLTQEGAVMGTPVYMPPEQAAGEIHASDERSDIYALGAILYEILTLQPPIDKHGGYAAILKRVLDGEIAPPALRSPERARAGLVPRELAAIAMQALARAPDRRYQSAEFLRRDIERFLEGRSVSAKEDTRVEQLVKLVKRNKALSALSMTAALLLTIAVTSALVVNLRARHDAEAAYLAFEGAQKDKEARTRLAVPALVKAAQLEVHQQQFNEAFQHVDLLLEYDPSNADGHLLKARLLVVKNDFKGASAELGKCLAGRPRDVAARELKKMCDEARADDDDKSMLVQIAQHLIWQEYPTLAEEMLRQHGANLDAVRQDLLAGYRQRVDAAWPQKTAKVSKNRASPVTSLDLNENGFHLKLVREDVRDLSPLKGMPLTSVDIDCPEVRDLSALRGMPLKDLRLTNVAGLDLSVLTGMSLTSLLLNNCHGSLDFSVLRGMPLTTLVIDNCSGLHDLSMVQGMPLTTVRLTLCPLTDLSGLQGAPLRTLQITFCPNVRDLAPLKDLPLTSLNLAGCSTVQDLTPLKALPLKDLDLTGTEVRDLAPLGGLPLVTLSLRNCGLLKDISGLKGLKLKTLELGGCARVDDLTPLQNMPLTYVDLFGTGVKDLSALKGMPLVRIGLGNCSSLTDLSALHGMPLSLLDLGGCSAVSDLSALRGMSLGTLGLGGCIEVTDLSPLQGMPLNNLQIDRCGKVTDLSPLKDAVLTSIGLNQCTGLKDLRGLQAMPFEKMVLSGCTELVNLDGLTGRFLGKLVIADCTKLETLAGLGGPHLSDCEIRNCPSLHDLSALKGKPLQQLTIVNCPKVTDLAALESVRLRELTIGGCPIKDLAPLKGMPLETLKIDRCLEVHDVSPLAGLPLVEIDLPPGVTVGMDGLRKMSTLQKIDGRPAAQFWRQFDEAKANAK